MARGLCLRNADGQRGDGAAPEENNTLKCCFRLKNKTLDLPLKETCGFLHTLAWALNISLGDIVCTIAIKIFIQNYKKIAELLF